MSGAAARRRFAAKGGADKDPRAVEFPLRLSLARALAPAGSAKLRGRQGSYRSPAPPPLPTVAPTHVPTVHSLTGPSQPRDTRVPRLSGGGLAAPRADAGRAPPPPHPTPFVLIGHAASFTPY